MSITEAELAADERTIYVDYGLGPIRVTYRPSALTPAFEAQAEYSNHPPIQYARAVRDWGVLQNDGTEYPRAEKWLRRLPTAFLRCIAKAITTDLDGDEHVVRDLRRALVTGGSVGYMPWWYPLIRAAKYLGVAPWELARQPRFWRDRALQAEAAELGAKAELAKQAERRRR